MARALKLRKSAMVDVSYQFVGAYRLRVEVVDVDGGMDPNIFLYRRDPYNPVTNEQLDVLFAMASPVDMADYPVGEPDPDAEFPFFRLDYMEIDVRSTRVADETWTTIVREANTLVLALDRLEELEEVEDVWAGPPPGGVSDSDSDNDADDGVAVPREPFASVQQLLFERLF